MTNSEHLNAIILTRVHGLSLAGLMLLYRELGSATAIMEHRKDIREVFPDASPRLIEAMKEVDMHRQMAEAELEYNIRNGIETLCPADEHYPQRLKECDDAPLVLYYKGTANLNRARVINIVGTRRCTVYGQDLIRRFVQELKILSPEVLIVSGLAYGVDINAHRFALENGLDTVGILAHGLDYLYPPRHKPTADEMLKHGGLLTEFPTNTNADKLNFVRRNRIVAGISDACILVESAIHGGGLITARLSDDYHRDVFAFPGAIGAPYSEGCNALIRDRRATLLTSAQDFITLMGWEEDRKLTTARQQGIERQLFPTLNEDEQTIVSTLQKINDQPINTLSIHTALPIPRLTSLLFQLEIKGVIKQLAGGTYHVLG